QRGLVKSRELFDHLDGSTNGVLRTFEAGHEGIADGLDDGAGSLPDDFIQDIELLTNEEVCVDVTDTVIERSGVLQIGEQVCQVGDSQALGFIDELRLVEIAEARGEQ